MNDKELLLFSTIMYLGLFLRIVHRLRYRPSLLVSKIETSSFCARSRLDPKTLRLQSAFSELLILIPMHHLSIESIPMSFRLNIQSARTRGNVKDFGSVPTNEIRNEKERRRNSERRSARRTRIRTS